MLIFGLGSAVGGQTRNFAHPYKATTGHGSQQREGHQNRGYTHVQKRTLGLQQCHGKRAASVS